MIEIVDPFVDEDESSTSEAPEGKGAVVKTSTRQTVFLPIPGLIRAHELKPGELVGTNKDSYIILEKLPAEFDSRVKAMEVDEKPTEDYTDVGGLDKQIQELIEAVVLPMTQWEKFEAIGIRAPKGNVVSSQLRVMMMIWVGVLLYGPPGTGKTLLARACAKNSDAIFLKLAAPQLVQMFIGDGAKMVRDAFDLAKEKIKNEGRKGDPYSLQFSSKCKPAGNRRDNLHRRVGCDRDEAIRWRAER